MGWLLLSHGHALPSICWQGCSSPRAAALLPSCHLLAGCLLPSAGWLLPSRVLYCPPRCHAQDRPACCPLRAARMHDALRHKRTCVRLFGCSFVLKSSLTTEVGCQGMVVGSRFEYGGAELPCASLGQVRCSVLQCSRGSRELLSFRWPSRTVKCSGWSSANHAHAFPPSMSCVMHMPPSAPGPRRRRYLIAP